MAVLRNTHDGSLEVDHDIDIPAGHFTNVTSVNKFGRCTDADLNDPTDVWDGANATDDIKIWVAPTEARIHDIASTSANDTSAGTGARTLRVYGLTDWDTAEVYEDVTLNGTSNVATTNSYVIIHRMKVMTYGSSGPNVGKITATAQTDATVTAQINVGEGQTQMAIYGVSSTQTAYVTQYYASALKATSSAAVNMTLYVNSIPDQELTGFLCKHTKGLQTTGGSNLTHEFKPYAKFNGPCILKLQGESTANNGDLSGGFDLILVDN